MYLVSRIFFAKVTHCIHLLQTSSVALHLYIAVILFVELPTFFHSKSWCDCSVANVFLKIVMLKRKTYIGTFLEVPTSEYL